MTIEPNDASSHYWIGGSGQIVQYVEPENRAIEIAKQWLVGYSPATRKAYGADIERWLDFCFDHGIAPMEATRAAIQTFTALSEESRGLSRQSVVRSLAAISGFYRYAVDEGYIAHNPADGVKRPKTGTYNVNTGISEADLIQLIKRARADSTRAYALVMLLAMTGLRISEALNANVGDIGTERGHVVLKVTRKGGKTAIVPLPGEVFDAIWANLCDYGHAQAEDPLFPTSTGGRFHRADAHKLFRRLGDTHPHALRHAFVTLSLENGVPLHEVQAAAGHADPRTTMRYNDAINNLDNAPSRVLAYLAE